MLDRADWEVRLTERCCGLGAQMDLDRRTLLIRCGAISALSIFPARGLSQTIDTKPLPLPDQKRFQSGDFVFPKEPGKYVPYNAGSKSTFEEERAQWERERDASVRLLASGMQSEYRQQLAKDLSRMTFEEFYEAYTDATPSGAPTPLSLGPVAVGHVGIIEIDGAGVPWVIEAMPEPSDANARYPKPGGVGRVKYDDWIKYRAGQIVWLGRLREPEEADKRALIVAEAKRLIGRPYDIMNFKLDDDKSFFCSKLVWLCVMRALKVAVDGKTYPDRYRPLSPKQILYAASITRLHDPGDYGTR